MLLDKYSVLCALVKNNITVIRTLEFSLLHTHTHLLGWIIRGLIPGRGKRLFSESSRQAMGPIHHPVQKYRGFFPWPVTSSRLTFNNKNEWLQMQVQRCKECDHVLADQSVSIWTPHPSICPVSGSGAYASYTVLTAEVLQRCNRFSFCAKRFDHPPSFLRFSPVPRLRMGGSVPLLPLYALVACAWTSSFSFYLYHITLNIVSCLLPKIERRKGNINHDDRSGMYFR